MILRLIWLAALWPLQSGAETFSIKEITYAEIEEFIPDVIDFNDFRHAPDAGLLMLPGVAFGEHFAGQTLAKRQDDLLEWRDILEDRSPSAPLTLLPGQPYHNLSIARDTHWGSPALHPMGPRGRNLGTGMLAIAFDPPVCYLAFRSAIDGMSRFGNVNSTILRGRSEGSLNLRFYDF